MSTSALPAHGNTPRRKFSCYGLNRDTILILVELREPVPHRRDKLEFLRDVMQRRIIRHAAQHVLHDLFVGPGKLHKEKSALAIFIFQVE
jgi:hypothetical protein